ncbi:MAG: hypothetical protein E8D48_01905 [Nitrospira sp.]|nr:MAG: hypothetical protein E8D48_01905 [Nitrospira sp.]
MRYSRAIAVALVLLIAVSAHAQQTDPRKLKDQLTGDAKGLAASNPQCKLFTQAEISVYVGVPVGPGENAAGGAGCSWHDSDYEASATVTVVPPNYFPEPKLVKGFKRLPDVGDKGWVAPDDGWSAGALVQDVAIVVGISGKTSTEASVVKLLQEVIKRRTK